MRSKIGTRGLLAAHVLALILLIAMVSNASLYSTRPEPAGSGRIPVTVGRDASYRSDPVPHGGIRSEPAAAPTPQLPGPADIPPADVVPPITPVAPPMPESPRFELPPVVAAPTLTEEPVRQSAAPDDQETATPPSEEPASAPESPATVEEDTMHPAAVVVTTGDAPVVSGNEPVEAAPESGSGPSLETDAAVSPEAPEMGEPEAANSPGAAEPDQGEETAAEIPLAHADLEVLGDRVYWLGPRHDIETALATVPEIGTLILLTPLPGYRVQGFDHVKTEVIPADMADLSPEAAERFLHLTSHPPRTVVVAVDAGARGAAYFKGAYLLANRRLSKADIATGLAPELEDAGSGRDEILHRLARFRD